MTEPLPAAVIDSTTARIPRNVPVRLTSITLCHLARSKFFSCPRATVPALFTRTLSLPNSLTAVATAASHWSGWVTSRWTYLAASPISAASALPSSSRMSPITTWAPSSTSRRASSAPMPRAPPLMSATFPSTRPGRSIKRLPFGLGGHQSAWCVKPFSGHQRQGKGGGDARRGRNHVRDGVDDAACGPGDRRVVVVALAAARHDVHGVRGLADDLDAVGTVAGRGLG